MRDRFRTLTDNCTGSQGDTVFNACGSGTGSDMCCTLLERLSLVYDIKSKLMFSVWSHPQVVSGIEEAEFSDAVPGGQPPKAMRAACMISNSTAIAEVITGIDPRFDLMCVKRA